MAAKIKEFTINFPGGKRADAHYDRLTVHTNQSVANGGNGFAPEFSVTLDGETL